MSHAIQKRESGTFLVSTGESGTFLVSTGNEECPRFWGEP